MADNPQNQLINLQAQQLAAQVANWAAQLEFQKERMRLLELPEMQGKLQIEIDRLAWDKARDAWEQGFKEASLTGTYKGQPTIEWLTQQAQMTGVLNGQQTLQGKLTDAQVNQMNQQMALANAQFLSNATGYLNGQKTFDRQKFEATQATDAWKFLATLTGPANAFKQAKAISSMPGGMQGIMSAWAGQYSPAGFAGVGSGGQATLEGLIGGGGEGSPYYYPPQQPYGPTFMPQPYYGYPYGGTNPPYGPGPGGGGPYPGYPPTTQPPGGTQPPTAPPAAPAPPTTTPPTTTPPTTTPPATTPPATTPGAASNAMDSGFYVWLRVHGYDPGGKDRDRLPEFIHNYMSLPAEHHAEYTTVGQRNPGIYQFDTKNWLDVVSMGFSPLPGQITANPNVPQITQAQYGEGAAAPDAATQAQHLASQGGRQGYWVQRNGQWMFIDSATAPPGTTPPGTVPAPPGTPIAPTPPNQPTGLTSGSVDGLWFGEGAQAPDANTQAVLKSSQGGQYGYWVNRGGGWTFIADDKLKQWSPSPSITPPGGETPTGPGDTGTGGGPGTPVVGDPIGGMGGFGGGSFKGFPGLSPASDARPITNTVSQPVTGLVWDNLSPDSKAALLSQNGGVRPAWSYTEMDQSVGLASTRSSTPGGWGYGAQAPYTYQGAGVQAPVNQWNYAPTAGGSMNVYPPGVQSNYSTPDISSQNAMSPQNAWNLYQYGATPELVQRRYAEANQAAATANSQLQAQGQGQGQTAGPFGPNPWTSSNVPLPNQISPQAYNNSYAYQRELGWAGFEDAGWDKALAQEAYERSLPKTGGPKRGSFAF